MDKVWSIVCFAVHMNDLQAYLALTSSSSSPMLSWLLVCTVVCITILSLRDSGSSPGKQTAEKKPHSLRVIARMSSVLKKTYPAKRGTPICAKRIITFLSTLSSNCTKYEIASLFCGFYGLIEPEAQTYQRNMSQ